MDKVEMSGKKAQRERETHISPNYRARTTQIKTTQNPKIKT